MMCTSLLGYTMSISVIIVNYLSISDYHKFLFTVLHVSSLYILGLFPCIPHKKNVYCANFLGYCTAFGVIVAIRSAVYSSFGLYIFFMSTFHYLEFLTTALTNPKNLSVDSYLLNHSMEYGIAAMAGLVEYATEAWYAPGLKHFNMFGVSGLGSLICILGDCLRKTAMFHAGKGFNHIVQEEKCEEHELVMFGVFSVIRHPSYLGWYLFSLGTQLVLCNPLCFTAYAIVIWMFFNERINEEEIYLHKFFGEEYTKYQKMVPHTGIPFIKGYTQTRRDYSQ